VKINVSRIKATVIALLHINSWF